MELQVGGTEGTILMMLKHQADYVIIVPISSTALRGMDLNGGLSADRKHVRKKDLLTKCRTDKVTF